MIRKTQFAACLSGVSPRALAIAAGIMLVFSAPGAARAACTGFPAGVGAGDYVVAFATSPIITKKSNAGANGIAGMLGYDTGTNTLQVCDGSNWQSLAFGSGISDGDKGDITVASSGASWTIDDDALDFTELKDALTLDASTDIAVAGTDVLSVTNSGTGNSFVVNDAASDTTPFVVDAAGQVGIGTSAPTTIFDVVGSGGHFKVGNTGDTIMFSGSSTNYLLAYDVAGALAFQTGGSNTRMYIGPAGYVGIGTASPASKLTVAGNTSSSSWTTRGIAFATDAATYTDTSSATSSTIALRAGNSLGVPTLASTNAITVTDAATLYIAGTPVAGANTTITRGNALFVQGGNSYFGGNIGVGNSTPTSPLYITKTYSAATGAEQYGVYSNTSFAAADSGFKQSVRASAFAAHTTGTQESVMGVLSLSGNAAAGTTTDASAVWARVDSSGGGVITNSYGLNVQNGSVATGTITNQYGVYVNGLTAGGTQNYAVYTAGTTKSYFGGPVGFGATSPDASSILDVSSTTKGFLPPRMTDVQQAAISSPADGLIVYDTVNDVIKLRANGAWVSLASGSGISDGDKGDITVASSGVSWTIDDDALDFTELKDALTLDASTDIAVTGSNVLSVTNSGTGNSFVVNDAASDTTPFVVDAAGQVGIGTSAPGYELEVRGTTPQAYFYDTANSRSASFGVSDGYNAVIDSNAGNVILKRAGTAWLTIGYSGASSVFNTGSVGVGAAPDASALLDVTSTTKGFLPPRMTDVQQAAISSPADGLIVYDTVNDVIKLRANGAWVSLASGAGISDGDKGDITVASSGASWTIDDDALDFTELKDALTLDASTDIAVSGTDVLSVTNTGTGNSFVVNDASSDTTPFVIDASGNVGIGTATPASALNIASGQIFVPNGLVSAPSYGFTNATNSGMYSPGTSDVRLSVNGADRFRLAGATAYLNGNVSVNSLATVPLSTIWVNGNATIGASGNVAAPSNGLLVQGSVGVGATSVDASAAMDVTSTTQGFLPPRMTDVQQAAISSPADGLIVYDTVNDVIKLRANGAWVSLASGSGISDGDKGDITVASSGASWTIDDDALDFTELKDALTLDASTDIAVDNAEELSITNTGTGNSFVVNDAASDTTPFVVDASGNVGVGVSAPRAALDVSGGALIGKAAVSNGTSTIDFSTGNSQYTADNCGAFNLHNMKDGGTYMFVVQGATSATCSFSAYSDAGSTALTVHMPPDHTATTVSTHTLYNFAVLGTHVYVAWTPGY